MRNMSFWLTTKQMRQREKTVTRRLGWWFLNSGDKVRAVVKGMGLKKGEKIKPICVINIISTRGEQLDAITKADCILEGFPDMSPAEFVKMICKHYNIKPDKIINRIEFCYEFEEIDK